MRTFRPLPNGDMEVTTTDKLGREITERIHSYDVESYLDSLRTKKRARPSNSKRGKTKL